MANTPDNPLPPDDQDDVSGFYKRNKGTPWGLIFIVIAGIAAAYGAYWLATHMEQRGLSIQGEGHIVATEKAGTWAMLAEGTLVRVTTESAQKFKLKTGPCKSLVGGLVGTELALDVAECTPGEPLLKTVATRMQRMGLKLAYWADAIEHKDSDNIAPFLGTPEIVAAMIDARFPDPQLISVYTPLFPPTLSEARRMGLPPPVVVHVKRNDFFIRRFTRPELAEFLARDHYVLGAAAAKGGWLVRQVQIGGPDLPPFERLLTAPEEEPFPKLLQSDPVTVSRRTPLPTKPAAAEVPPPQAP